MATCITIWSQFNGEMGSNQPRAAAKYALAVISYPIFSFYLQ